MLYIFAIGCYFASSLDLQSAFGIEFVQYGLSLIFLALLSISMILPFKYGVNRHNRFLLAFVFVMETIVFAELINVGYTILSYSYPAFPKALQKDCLQYKPSIYTDEQCAEFYNSDRTAGFRLFWTSYFSRRGNKYDNQILANIETGICCGFFQPFRCITNTNGFPKNRNDKYVSSELAAARVTCSTHANYYPQQTDCVNYIDFAADPPIIGGCYYDLGTGYCLTDSLSSTTMGCASATEDYCVNLIKPHSLLIMGLSVTNFFYMFLACVMWWKRKETDIFPSHVEEEHKVKYIDYSRVKFQFEIDPHPGVLKEEGFVPEDDELDKTVQLTQRDRPLTPTRNRPSSGRGSVSGKSTRASMIQVEDV